MAKREFIDITEIREPNYNQNWSVLEFINRVMQAPRVTEQDIVKPVLDKIRAEITDCLEALDGIEKSGFNIYLPNEMSGRRLTYQQCLEFFDKYKAEIEPQESEVEDGNDKE